MTRVIQSDRAGYLLPIDQPGAYFANLLVDWPAWFPSCYVLVHAIDGVIWGRVEPDGVQMRSATAILDTAILDIIESWQQVRIFDHAREFFLWRDGDGYWAGRYLGDVPFPQAELTPMYSRYMDESYLLWGNRSEDAGNGFTHVWDASQGMNHILPISLAVSASSPPHLCVRHYIEFVNAPPLAQGFLRIATSRLVGFDLQG